MLSVPSQYVRRLALNPPAFVSVTRLGASTDLIVEVKEPFTDPAPVMMMVLPSSRPFTKADGPAVKVIDRISLTPSDAVTASPFAPNSVTGVSPFTRSG